MTSAKEERNMKMTDQLQPLIEKDDNKNINKYISLNKEDKMVILNNIRRDNLPEFKQLMFSYLKLFEYEYLEEDSYKLDDFTLSFSNSANKNTPLHSLMYYKEPSENPNPITGNRVPEETLSFILDHIEGDTYKVNSMIFSSYRRDLKNTILYPSLEFFYEFSVFIYDNEKKNLEFVFLNESKKRQNTNFDIMIMCYTIYQEKLSFDMYFSDRKGNSFLLSKIITALNFDSEKLVFKENEMTRCPCKLEDLFSEREISMIEIAML